MTTPIPDPQTDLRDVRRVFEPRRLWAVTPSALAEACRLLAETAHQQLGPISCVIGVANGGLIPATLIATSLMVPGHRVAARHNPTGQIYLPASGKVICDLTDLGPALSRHTSGSVLVVDDICGTGATLDAVLTQLQVHAAAGTRFSTATLCRNLGAPSPPDLYCWEVADWVVFPWEASPPAGQPATPLPVPSKVITRA